MINEEYYIHIKCIDCGWTGRLCDCPFGHDDYICPDCGHMSLEENYKKAYLED